MLGLLGLLSAMFAGLMGDSVMAERRDSTEDPEALPPVDEARGPGAEGDFITDDEGAVGPPLVDAGAAGDPAPAPDATPEPEPEPDFVPVEELPGEGPVGGTDPDSDAQFLIGDDQANLLIGGAGDDGLMGGAGADTLQGGAGHDALVGADDDEADVLSGGVGDDSLRLGAGDIAHGDAGADGFTLADYGPNVPPAVIADYTPSDDHIVLLYDAALHPAPVLLTEIIDGTDDMAVILDGVHIAIVQGAPGLTPGDIQLRAA
jgi:RTX calcium-binding nonapeptide repeat (4 copies)